MNSAKPRPNQNLVSVRVSTVATSLDLLRALSVAPESVSRLTYGIGPPVPQQLNNQQLIHALLSCQTKARKPVPKPFAWPLRPWKSCFRTQFPAPAPEPIWPGQQPSKPRRTNPNLVPHNQQERPFTQHCHAKLVNTPSSFSMRKQQLSRYHMKTPDDGVGLQLANSTVSVTLNLSHTTSASTPIPEHFLIPIRTPIMSIFSYDDPLPKQAESCSHHGPSKRNVRKEIG